MKKPTLALAALLLTAAVAGAAVPPDVAEYGKRLEQLSATQGQGSESERLRKLFDLLWEFQMHSSPEYATFVGYPGLNDRWSDLSPESLEFGRRITHVVEGVLASIDRAKLAPAEQVNYDLGVRHVREAIEGEPFHGEYMPVNQVGGPQQGIPQLLSIMPARNLKDYEDIIARLRGVPRVIDQTMALLDRGLKEGITPPKVTLRDVPGEVESLLVDDPLKSPMLKAFQKFPETVPTADRERLTREAVAAFRDQVTPAVRKLHGYLVNTYLPASRESIAMADLPNGRAWYAYQARVSTTTNLTPEQIHQIGLSEVKRIRKEMDELIASTGFKGSFEDFCKFLRTDPRFFYDRPEDLLMGYRDIAKRIDPELIKLFGKLPRLPYGVIPVPSYSEKSQTTAYYEDGSPAAGRPGEFYANTYDLKSRPKWEMEALTAHEAVPGHHLQISLAQELEGVPEWRKHDDYTAFVEGWGLYAESLGSEIGLYKDPYSRFGQLTYEMWRAIRLVVDTGMHTSGWTRQQAIDYFKANSAKAEHDIEVEVDRYIVWPGQALAYKIGELKIKEMRAYAQKELGPGFDVRAFHDHLLGNGAVPLDLLEKNVKAWVAETKAGAAERPARQARAGEAAPAGASTP
ncbi:MAG TPA: DUF885 domain-containing protein [Thermoanaerobaculia bacterium]|nr:DUF885 domain-containing protein [Thermoanaerobaculia bacterium]